MAQQENKYYYLDNHGSVKGPVWLSVMRHLYHREGRVNKSTEVSLDGTTDWHSLEHHPEITEREASLPALRRLATTPSRPSWLLVGMVILLLLVIIWQMIEYNRVPPVPESPPSGESAPRAPSPPPTSP